MITLRKLTLQRGIKVLLRDVDLMVHAGMRIGLVGANGCGKSSLFALMLGELHSETGDLDMQAGLTIAHVAQEVPSTIQAAIEYVTDGDTALRAIEAAIAAAEKSGDGERLALEHERYEHALGYGAAARAAALMHGLGFSASQQTTPVAEFSGGWRMRLNLARALMCRSDVLLLDEPTNHLDLDAVIWLENWLRNYRGTLFLISHDREFLDAAVTSIIYVELQKLKLYTGNYSDFEVQYASQLANQQSAYQKQQREIAHLHSYVERFRAKATKARQAQSRMKALARMEIIAPAHVDTPFTFRFADIRASPNPLLSLEDAVAGYGDKTVIQSTTLSIPEGSRIGLLGANGAGKSTLIQTLAGMLPPIAGNRREGKNLKIGYFAQHQLEALRNDESPLRHLMRLEPTAREQDLRDFLGSFDFRGDMVSGTVEYFSGGERARLALAIIVRQQPNLLLLDEPTNHLDLDMRHALTLALSEYEGGLVLVSHDRHLIRTTTDTLMLVADGRVQPFDGDLDDYRDWLTEARAGQKTGTGDDGGTVNRRDQRRNEAQARNASFAKKKGVLRKVEAAEKRMAQLSSEKARLAALLASEGFYTGDDREKIQAALFEAARVDGALQQAEGEWLTLQEELETMGVE